MKRICVVSFSSTGMTERVARGVAEAFAAEFAANGGGELPVEYIPYTLPAQRVELNFTAEDLVIAAAPVYAGRLPNKILPELQAKLQGSGTAALAADETHAEHERLHEQDEYRCQQGDDQAEGLACDQVGEVGLLGVGDQLEHCEDHRGDEKRREHDGEYAEDLVRL